MPNYAIELDAVTAFSSTQKVALGTERYDPATNSWFVYVQNAHTSDLVVGDGVCSLTTDALRGTVKRFGATSTLSATLRGIAVSAIPTLYYGWIQCGGYCAAIHVEGTTDILIGDSLIVSTGTTYLVKSSATTVPPGGHCVAWAGFTTNGESTIIGYVNCR